MKVIIFSISLILLSFCADAQAETCKVGVDGCSWTCKRVTLQPGQATCLAIPRTPENCEIGSSVSMCGTTCTCSKSQTAKTCTVGVDGCTYNCKPPKPGMITCLALPVVPETCVIGSSATTCGTTCTCEQTEKCTVGEKGCNWSCVTYPPPKGMVQCMGYPSTTPECYPGQTVSMCGTTCTCSQSKKCTVGKNGCRWSCITYPPPEGMAQCMAYPSTSSECYPGETVSMCGTTCTCTQPQECIDDGENGSKNFTLLNLLRRLLQTLFPSRG